MSLPPHTCAKLWFPLLKSAVPVNEDHLHIKMLASCFSSAADWKLDEPAWSGRLKITAKGKMAYIKLEDKNTGK